MCGIAGYIGPSQAAPVILDILKRLEYRGYDSAGIAVVEQDGVLTIAKRAGSLEVLTEHLGDTLPMGSLGIGHTRWATHGKPSDRNAHPHMDCSSQIAVIHNGIIENHVELKAALAA